MSHDRGCPCGRERYEYDECSKSDCYKREAPSVKPTFNSEKLKVSDVFYGVKERNLAFHRKKIHQEIDGQDWFRYDRPLCSYELVTFKVLGILRKELEGKWKYKEDADLETEYFLESTNDTHVQRYTDFLDDEAGDDYFVDKDAALEYIKILEAQAKELDKT